jgi:hypothetical protein
MQPNLLPQHSEGSRSTQQHILMHRDALNRTAVELDSERVKRLEQNVCRNSDTHSSILPRAWKLLWSGLIWMVISWMNPSRSCTLLTWKHATASASQACISAATATLTVGVSTAARFVSQEKINCSSFFTGELPVVFVACIGRGRGEDHGYTARPLRLIASDQRAGGVRRNNSKRRRSFIAGGAVAEPELEVCVVILIRDVKYMYFLLILNIFVHNLYQYMKDFLKTCVVN